MYAYLCARVPVCLCARVYLDAPVHLDTPMCPSACVYTRTYLCPPPHQFSHKIVAYVNPPVGERDIPGGAEEACAASDLDPSVISLPHSLAAQLGVAGGDTVMVSPLMSLPGTCVRVAVCARAPACVGWTLRWHVVSPRGTWRLVLSSHALPTSRDVLVIAVCATGTCCVFYRAVCATVLRVPPCRWLCTPPPTHTHRSHLRHL